MAREEESCPAVQSAMPGSHGNRIKDSNMKRKYSRTGPNASKCNAHARKIMESAIDTGKNESYRDCDFEV
jgi:hypothetical protein